MSWLVLALTKTKFRPLESPRTTATYKEHKRWSPWQSLGITPVPSLEDCAGAQSADLCTPPTPLHHFHFSTEFNYVCLPFLSALREYVLSNPFLISSPSKCHGVIYRIFNETINRHINFFFFCSHPAYISRTLTVSLLG